MSTQSVFDEYYHDCHIRLKNGRPIFISASFTGCSIGHDYVHETVLVNSLSHRSVIMYLEILLPYWDSSRFNPQIGMTEHLAWRENLDIPRLTGCDVVSLPNHVFSSPLAIYGQLPARSPLLTYPALLDPDIPTFRICPAPNATHLFVKVPWHLRDLELTDKQPEPSADQSGPLDKQSELPSYQPEPPAVSEAYATAVRHRFPSALYWHALNCCIPYGVDYWILPLL